MSKLLLLICVASLAGCKTGVPSGHSCGIQQVSADWDTFSDSPLPGIDAGAVTKVKLMAGNPEGVDFVLWTDSTIGLAGHGTGKRDHAIFACEYTGEKHETVSILARTADGKTGSVSVEGREFDLANGQLIMVSMEDGQLAVQQSRLPIDEIKVQGTGLREFGTQQPEIFDFYMRTRGVQEIEDELDEEFEAELESEFEAEFEAEMAAESRP